MADKQYLMGYEQLNFQVVESLTNAEDLICRTFELPDELSEWEKNYETRYKGNARLLRQILIGNLKTRTMIPIERQVCVFRYYHGFFDTVVTSFVIGDVHLPTLVMLDPEVRGQPFRKSLCIQSGYEWQSKSPLVTDLSLLAIQSLDFSTADVVMREYLPGTKFSKLKVMGRVYFVGGTISLLLPDDFPVEEAVWNGAAMQVLRPYGLEKMTLNGLDFVPHLWEPMCASHVSSFVHGVTILFSGEEFNVKRCPTVFIRAEEDVGPVGQKYPAPSRKGVWEVSLTHEVDQSKPQFHYVCPRPGGSFITVGKAKSYLRGCATVLDLIVPEVSPISITYVTSGPFQGSFGQEGVNLWFDSGWRLLSNDEIVAADHVKHQPYVSPDQIYKVGDCYHHCRGTTETISPLLNKTLKPTITGSKICVFDGAGGIFFVQGGWQSL